MKIPSKSSVANILKIFSYSEEKLEGEVEKDVVDKLEVRGGVRERWRHEPEEHVGQRCGDHGS